VFYLQTEGKAERVGFEPTRRFNTVHAISSRPFSGDNVLEAAGYVGVTVLLCTIMDTDLGVDLFHAVDE
jgi:hypothetical protein